jgi:hypothetical protein
MLQFLDRLRNPWVILAIFIALMFIPAVSYAMASFYHLRHPGNTIIEAIIVAILFAASEYIVKVPLIHFGFGKGLTRTHIQLIWVIVTFIVVMVLDYFYPNPKSLF